MAFAGAKTSLLIMSINMEMLSYEHGATERCQASHCPVDCVNVTVMQLDYSVYSFFS